MKITIKDYTRYSPLRCRNGGDYGYEETATIEHFQIIGGYHWTTADFDYCENCGCFEQNMLDHDRICGEYIPTPGMEHAVRLLGENTPEQVIAMFNAWADGLTLEIKE